MGITHFSGPIIGSSRAAGGLLKNFPLSIANQIDNFVYWNDFTRGEADYDETADWTENDIGSPTAATVAIVTDTRHGVLLVNGGTGADTGIQTEFTGANGAGEFCVPTNNKSFAFGARFKKNDANGGSIWVGLGETQTTTDILVATTGALTNLTNGIGFWTDETSATLALVNKRASATTGTLGIVTLTDDTYVDVAFRVDVGTDISAAATSGSVTGYLRDSTTGRWNNLGKTSSNVVPNTGICPQFATTNVSSVSLDIDLSIDYIWYVETR